MDTLPNKPKRPAWKILLLGLCLVGFSIWSVGNLLAVHRMRRALEVRVGWLAGLQHLQSDLHADMTASEQVAPPADVVQAFQRDFQAQLARMSSDEDAELARLAHRAQASLTARAELAPGLEILSGLIGALRSSNRRISVELGKSWTFINTLAIASLLLAAATLYALWLSHRRALALAYSRQVVARGKQQLGQVRHALEQARAESTHAVQSARRLKEQFLATLSHELRTPMHGIMGMTELALLTELNAEQSEYLTQARESARSLLQVIDGILDYALLASGRVPLEQREFPLRACLREAVEALRPASDAKQLSLQLELDDSLPEWAWGDPERIGRLLTELLDNALKFTDRGDVVVRARFEPDQEQLELVVRDTGQGVPEDLQHEIFEAFLQGDGSSSRRHGGLGLGLALCWQIAKLMDGSVQLQSEPGRGTEVRACLRLVTQPALSTG